MEKITSRQNSLIMDVVKLQIARRLRQAQRQFVADGTKLLDEAIRWCPDRLEAVIVREGTRCPVLPAGVRAVEVPEQLMGQISNLETPEGILFLCAMAPEPETKVRPGTLVLDGVQDPGNVGTILRTADALDVPVLLTEGCADPYNPKTIRAAMGAIFRSAPVQTTRWDLIQACRSQKIPLLAATLSDTALDLRDVGLRKAAVVVGSEGQGVSLELTEAADRQIIIPMTPRCESLNAAVAAAIFMWEMSGL